MFERLLTDLMLLVFGIEIILTSDISILKLPKLFMRFIEGNKTLEKKVLYL